MDLCPVDECFSATRPKDTFDGSAQGKSPCKIVINEGLADGGVESRPGAQVVLKCERNNNEGACDMLCQL